MLTRLEAPRVKAADLSFPINVSTFGGRLVILDGFHRLLHFMAAGAARMQCVHGVNAHPYRSRAERQSA